MEKKNYKILVVDDEIEYQRVFSYILKKNGYTVQTCSSALQALEILAHTDINLVMTDLKMPDMDGVELVKQVKPPTKISTSWSLPLLGPSKVL